MYCKYIEPDSFIFVWKQLDDLGEVESPRKELTRCESGNRVRICQVQLKINLQYISQATLKFSQPQTIFPPYLQHGKPFLCLWRLRPKLECKVHGLCQRSRTEAEKKRIHNGSFSGVCSLLCQFSRGRCLSPLLSCSCLIVGQRPDLS